MSAFTDRLRDNPLANSLTSAAANEIERIEAIHQETLDALQSLFDIFIEGGYAEDGDAELLDRIHGILERPGSL